MRAWPVSNGMVRWLLTALVVVERVGCVCVRTLVAVERRGVGGGKHGACPGRQTYYVSSDIMYVRTLCAWYTGAGALGGRVTWMVAMAAMATRLSGKMMRW